MLIRVAKHVEEKLKQAKRQGNKAAEKKLSNLHEALKARHASAEALAQKAAARANKASEEAAEALAQKAANIRGNSLSSGPRIGKTIDLRKDDRSQERRRETRFRSDRSQERR
jgi:hypothetical protein